MASPPKTNSLTFNDGVRSIDYVLVWDTSNNDATKADSQRQRKSFETILTVEGLQLEYEEPKLPNKLFCIKVHAPLKVLREYCETLKLRMPMKFAAFPDGYDRDETEGCLDRVLSEIGLNMDTNAFPKQQPRLTAIYSRDKEYLFDADSENFWTPSIRFRIVQFILDNTKNDSDCGITRLLSKGIYSAAYPLHDGDLDTSGSMRYLLNKEWASLSKIFKYQPLDCLKDYFGVKIGLYFSWLGFYTLMLIPASFVGFVCFIYSLVAVFYDKPSEQICKYNGTIKMCPLCEDCDYWDLQHTCDESRLTYLFDNPSTLFFAVFMSLWAACFLELWKRYSAEITHRWDLTGFDVYHEHPRQQYLAQLAKVKKTQLNVVTGKLEPKVPWRRQVGASVISYSVVLLLVFTVIAAVLGVVVYRISNSGALILKASKFKVISSHMKNFTTVTAAIINLLFIIIFGMIYGKLAVWLTEKEMLRTQTEFDNSLTLKIYLLQFVNYYASIFYIAFFKGKFIGNPGNYVTLFGYRQEECPPGGCLLQLSIQLIIIMVGKQILNAIKEMLAPYFSVWWKALRTFTERDRASNSSQQWVKDYKLVDFETQGLFPEYLEMVLQFGFITIFVAAFPLAPLFALINNVLEIRLDAKKFIQCYRRTVPQRINDIGVWYRILDSIGKLSIITNALIIAFTSDFIPRLVYMSDHGNLDNYVEFTLNNFNTSSLQYPPKWSTYNESICRYPNYSYYKPEGDLSRSEWYWHVMGARFAFVLFFQNLVTLFMIILRWAIPDMPRELRNRIRREEYMTKKIILEQISLNPQINQTPPYQTPQYDQTPKFNHNPPTIQNPPINQNPSINQNPPINQTAQFNQNQQNNQTPQFNQNQEFNQTPQMNQTSLPYPPEPPPVGFYLA